LGGDVGEAAGSCVGFAVGVPDETTEVDDETGVGEEGDGFVGEACGNRVAGCISPDSRVDAGV
jgi:hypothetical protein